MSINPFIYDLRALKFRCIQAYFHFQLLEAQKITEEGEGIVCTNNYEKVRANLVSITELITTNKNTYEDLGKQAKVNPFISPYYNEIGKIVKKHFKLLPELKREDYLDLTDEEFKVKKKENDVHWIPSFLALEVFRIFTDKGYKDFADVDFLSLQGEYEAFKDKEKGK